MKYIQYKVKVKNVVTKKEKVLPCYKMTSDVTKVVQYLDSIFQKPNFEWEFVKIGK